MSLPIEPTRRSQKRFQYLSPLTRQSPKKRMRRFPRRWLTEEMHRRLCLKPGRPPYGLKAELARQYKIKLPASHHVVFRYRDKGTNEYVLSFCPKENCLRFTHYYFPHPVSVFRDELAWKIAGVLIINANEVEGYIDGVSKLLEAQPAPGMYRHSILLGDNDIRFGYNSSGAIALVRRWRRYDSRWVPKRPCISWRVGETTIPTQLLRALRLLKHYKDNGGLTDEYLQENLWSNHTTGYQR